MIYLYRPLTFSPGRQEPCLFRSSLVPQHQGQHQVGEVLWEYLVNEWIWLSKSLPKELCGAAVAEGHRMSSVQKTAHAEERQRFEEATPG